MTGTLLDAAKMTSRPTVGIMIQLFLTVVVVACTSRLYEGTGVEQLAVVC
jgi:hypothetical protein